MQSTSSSIWHRECDSDPKVPRPGSTSRQVASYIFEMACIMGYEYSSADVIGFCQEHGYGTSGDFNLAAVFKELIRLGVSASRQVLGPIPDSVWGWAVLDDLDRPGYVVRCPSRRWILNRATGRITNYLCDCLSPLCVRCARQRTESDLLRACWAFRNADRIWVAVVPYDKAVIDRVKKRRSRLGGGLYWTRRIDTDSLHFYSSVKLTGTDEPVEWISMTRNEALRNLHSVTLALPGPKQRRFTGSWAPPKKDRRKQSDRKFFDLGRNHPQELMDLAEMAAEHELKVKRGLKVAELSTLEVEEIWLPLLKSHIDAQWIIRRTDRESNN
jgi:hypothetical protein